MSNGTAESASAANMRIVALLCLDEMAKSQLACSTHPIDPWLLI
jgi:hypothetical protein